MCQLLDFAKNLLKKLQKDGNINFSDYTMKDDKDEKKKIKIEEEIDDQDLKEENYVKILREECLEYENKYKRALADYQNLEKRVFEEKGNWVKQANKELILRFLPILDTLMLASTHVKDQGLKLSIQQFLDTLKNEGIEKIQTHGKEFNPHTMECIQIIDGEEGKVIEEVRAGYTLYDKVIRPAQVKVGRKSE